MKLRLVLLVIALLCIGAAGCGRASNDTRPSSQKASSPTTSGGAKTVRPDSATAQRYLNDGDAEKVNDHDRDNRNSNHEDGDGDSSEEYETTFDNGDYHDSDDGAMLNFGKVASRTEARAITMVVKRYYAAAAAGNGARACSLMAPAVAKSLVESYDQDNSPAYLHGSTCQAIMSRVFEHFHKRLSGAVAVTSVRGNGKLALAFTGSSTMPASDTPVERTDGTWGVASLIGQALP